MEESFLLQKLKEREQENAYRKLRLPDGKTDFCSNDYLGIAKNNLLAADSIAEKHYNHGSSGSRLLSGNYPLIEETEAQISSFHKAEAGLIFNSGYDANLGLLSCIPKRGDTVLYDYLSHASLRDGIRLSFAHAFAFRHNDLNDLEKKLKEASGNIFVVTESVFSMDGDMAPISQLVALTDKYGAHLIVDEAHATGVIGEKGEGLVNMLHVEQRCFARIHTFGKACGAHGAIILGSDALKNFLINFSRAFIYTTALPPAAVQAVKRSYEVFPALVAERKHLQHLIRQLQSSSLAFELLPGETPIQGVLIPGNERVKSVAARLQQLGLDVRPILYPSVPAGKERLRIVLHSFNSDDEVQKLIAGLQ